MKALLLAAGLGTRLKPITEHLPKCLVPIRHKPLLSYWLDLLLPYPINQIIINTHYLPKLVHDYIQSSSWRDAIIVTHEPILLGTAGTMLNNRIHLQDEAFLLAHADNLTRFDMAAFKKAHFNRQTGIEITMMTFDTDTPESCGIVELDEYNAVIGFHEKSHVKRGTLANAAVYIIEPSVIDFIASLGRSVVDMSTEVLPHYLGRIQTFHNTNYHRDIGTLQSLQLAEMEFSK
jgi:mannose-1-phosphate guanylyltransferase